MAVPETVPLVVPFVTQGVLLTTMVPDSSWPDCFHSMRTVQLSEVEALFQVPFQVPSRGAVGPELGLTDWQCGHMFGKPGHTRRKVDC